MATLRDVLGILVGVGIIMFCVGMLFMGTSVIAGQFLFPFLKSQTPINSYKSLYDVLWNAFLICGVIIFIFLIGYVVFKLFFEREPTVSY